MDLCSHLFDVDFDCQSMLKFIDNNHNLWLQVFDIFKRLPSRIQVGPFSTTTNVALSSLLQFMTYENDNLLGINS